MKPIIKVSGLSKQYRIQSQATSYNTLRDALARMVRAPVQNIRGRWNGSGQTIWALRDVNFEVLPGEVIGIIGRNGAGKSTLLKVLSRITEPTQGRAELYGRVASLLEVGTGFHPELTGRENIYLNGAILGMKKIEIDQRFDEIVEFSELEKFLETPVKWYSTGMYMRLAFAVASHLEPEILVIDEVLAVGDAQFQKKCLGKMSDVASKGRTVLFVSHNTVAIQSLCQRALRLEQGVIVDDGSALTVVGNYLKSASGTGESREECWPAMDSAPGNETVRLHRVRVRRSENVESEPLTTATPFAIEIEYWNLVPDARLHVTLHIYTKQDLIAFTTGSGAGDPEFTGRPMKTGLFRATCYVPADLLNVGPHRFKVLIIKDGSSVLFEYHSAVMFEIVDLAERQFGSYGKEPGVVKPALPWKTEQISEYESF